MNNETIGELEHIFSQMEQLRKGDDFKGAQAYADFMFKYFPEEAWHPIVNELSKNKIQSEFVNLENNSSHKIIADYYTLSGICDNYFGALLPLQIDTFRLKKYLNDHLVNNGPEIPLSVAIQNEKGIYMITVPLRDQAKEYKSEAYEMVYYPLKPLPDITISLVNIQQLAAMFKGVNWEYEFLLGAKTEDETFESRLQQIENDLERLSAAEPGRSLMFRELRCMKNLMSF